MTKEQNMNKFKIGDWVTLNDKYINDPSYVHWRPLCPFKISKFQNSIVNKGKYNIFNGTYAFTNINEEWNIGIDKLVLYKSNLDLGKINSFIESLDELTK